MQQRLIGRGQSETQHPEDRRQGAFSLPQGQVDDEPERQRGFDGEIGILPLPATFADPHGLPSGDRIRGHPHGDIASLDQCSVVCRPISDVVFCLVLRVHSRLHVEIIHLPSLRWPGGRSWRTEGAGSVHQRLVSVWMLIAMVIAVRQALDFTTTWRAAELLKLEHTVESGINQPGSNHCPSILPRALKINSLPYGVFRFVR